MLAGKDNFEEAADFIQQQFLNQVQNPSRLIYPYKTVATDTKNIQFIFKAVKDVFVTAYLRQMGLITGGGKRPVCPPNCSQTMHFRDAVIVFSF